MTLKEAIKILTDSGIDSPEYDARELMRAFGGINGIITMSSSSEKDEFITAVERRKSREPLQYILGTVGFYREEYEVSSDCLIPRSDTEILVDYAVKSIPQGEMFMDLCTGSGCIAISTLKNTVDTRCIAVDISDGALRIAAANAEKNGVFERLTLQKCDLMSAAPLSEDKPYAVLSNPPYIRNDVYRELSEEIYREPKIAFIGGDDGLDFYRRLLPMAMELVKADGFAAFEIGYDQGEAIKELAKAEGFTAEIIKDYSSNDRVAIIKGQKK